ncbi:aminoglycoside phosphotransferase [Cohnella xylanilytica]|uniref:phosphotransferase family protein n=1 Tax=Cohnella xylanilytica TaxID=557555 RepID=UPI001AFD4678|nr:aminoglycoside phosphotransferase family protein [Cohnella xylanilytica]GIO16312.1 aminoglycoside phosphotransferase [Cohnella xylanilytica]
MESQTKNKQPRATIDRMIARACPGVTATGVSELTEGFFNAAYSVGLSDGSAVVLKVGPAEGTPLMSHERNIMSSEVRSMRLVAERTDVPVARILFYDDSREIGEADYFIMEKLPGRSYHSAMNELDDEARERIERQIGQYNSRMNGIVGERFGYFGQTDKQGSDWFEVYRSILMDAVRDAEALKIDLRMDPLDMLELLRRDADAFREVAVPKLVHWDLWAGNVFIENGAVTGLIDFERCLWADPLLEVGFRSFASNPHFLEGYGLRELTASQRIRIRWYDLYLYLISALECDYRQYEDRGTYEWAIARIREGMAALKEGGLEP